MGCFKKLDRSTIGGHAIDWRVNSGFKKKAKWAAITAVAVMAIVMIVAMTKSNPGGGAAGAMSGTVNSMMYGGAAATAVFIVGKVVDAVKKRRAKKALKADTEMQGDLVDKIDKSHMDHTGSTVKLGKKEYHVGYSNGDKPTIIISSQKLSL